MRSLRITQQPHRPPPPSHNFQSSHNQSALPLSSMKTTIFYTNCFLLLSLTSACDRCSHTSEAAFSSSDFLSGACGYGSAPLHFNRRYSAAAASPTVYRGGVGCGGCFQIRCKDPKLCSGAGAKVVVTDLSESNRTAFVLGASAVAAMARPGMVPSIKHSGIVEIEYKRIPCEYPKRNLSIRVEESSRRPSSLAVKLLYQGGQTDVVEVDVASVGSPVWQFMSRSYGPVWKTNRAPAGPLQFRFVVTGGFDGKWVWAREAVLPADWRTGEVYDAGVKITDIAQEPCSPCDTHEWR